ncbi:exocyst complex component EXO70C1-like [Elaeis guineensis]|uniref:Exocyst subunit Exo70 family protein n=1 Tax=Elaeis guineensis var. tenera TaxID=51953 RepID=A0A8N4IA97_ELAGV|nr:exocyst complex component EXO70B1-like [Elaeis guineensis]
METKQSPLPKKSNSFSSSSREEKLRESDRNLSLGAIKFGDRHEKKETDGSKEDSIEEEVEKEDKEQERVEEKATEEEETSNENVEESDPSFIAISDEIDHFLGVLASLQDVQDQGYELPKLPEPIIEKFIDVLEKEIATYESGGQKWSPDHDEISLLDAFNRVHKLASALTPFSSEPRYNHAMNRAGVVLHDAMAFLEDEFFSLLDENSRGKQQDPGSTSSKTKRPPSFSRPQQQQQHEHVDRCILPSAESSTINEEYPQTYPTDIVERLRSIAAVMISAGYVTECCEVFSVARRNAIFASLSSLGCEKISIDDVQRMAWDSLEGEIATWIKAFRHSITVSFPSERELFDTVFSGHKDIADSLFNSLALGAISQLLNFAEAVAMTNRSAEKLFKMLDIYETLRDSTPTIDAIFSVDGNEEESLASPVMDLKSEISALRCRLGEAAVAIFGDLESSIKTDTGKTPVPGGAVHPLTRYVMNYLKYACEYKNTLEQVFKDHQRTERPSSYDGDDEPPGSTRNNDNQSDGGIADDPKPFAAQLMVVMELLHSNLDAKSRLYKDQALCNIFLMNNGRYIMKKIKGAAEIHELLGDAWCRKRSSELRQYHKNYQRETWSKVLACFKDEGLNVRGNVSKPVLKERFKSFNAMIDEIHKTQSSWVVSDEQLQSEMRVSISAVVVPAYRSFLGRFSQYLDPGRQTEKYIKFGADDLENYIDELFDGNPSSMARRRM